MLSSPKPQALPGWEASRQAVRSSGIDPLQFLTSPSCRCEIICFVCLGPEFDLDRHLSLNKCEYFHGVKEWGKDGLFVEFPPYRMDGLVEDCYEDIARRKEYLRVVANISTCTALRFVNVELFTTELSELWEALSSKVNLKELSFLGYWQYSLAVLPSSDAYPYGTLDPSEVIEGLLSTMMKLDTVEKLSVDFAMLLISEMLLTRTVSDLSTSCLTSLQLSGWEQLPWTKSFNTIVENKNHVLVNLALEEFLVDDSELISFMLCLKENSRLERLSLNRCRGFSSSDSVIGAVLDALGASGLPKLCIDGTPLEGNEVIRAQLDTNAFTHVRLKSQQKVAAAAARLFICGDPYAGKTTLLTTLSHFLAGRTTTSASSLSHFEAGRTTTSASSLSHFEAGRTTTSASSSSLFRCCWPTKNQRTRAIEVRPLVEEGVQRTGSIEVRPLVEEGVQRTRGIEVRPLVKEGVQVSLWDMAGQAEFHAFHDHMFPNSNAQANPSFFMFLWSPSRSKNDGPGDLKSDKEFEISFRYWLKFIASKTRQSNVARKIIIVLTRIDQVPRIRVSIAHFMDQLLQDFQNIVEVAGVWEVDSRKLESVENVASCIFSTAREVLRNVQVYKICAEVRDHFTYLPSKRKNPVITWEEFKIWCATKFHIDDLDILKAIASSLNESGDFVYLSEMPFLIVNPSWFCQDIMGNLIHFSLGDQSKKTIPITSGVVTQEYLEEFLKGEQGGFPSMEGAVLVQLMEALHLCCRVPNRVPLRFFIPTMLSGSSSDAERPLAWRGAIQDLNPTFIYMGRRLECRKKDLTFLTPGLFPLIQVSFQNEFRETADVKLHKHFISICYEDSEIIIEFCNALGEHVIDILVRSLSEADQTTIVQDKVVGKVVRICAQRNGNQGVQLVEGIIRPDCLKEPVCAHKREDQCVLIEELKKDLKRQLQENPEKRKFLHTWKENPYFGAGPSSIYELLGHQESSMLVKTYEAKLGEVEQELGTPAEAGSSEQVKLCRQFEPARLESWPRNSRDTMGRDIADIKNNTAAIKVNTAAMNAKMDVLNAKMDIIQRDVANISRLQSKVLPQLQSRIEQLLYFGVEKEVGRMPRFCFLTTEGLGVARKLVTALITDVKSVRIELFCEDRPCHRIKEQEGICVTTLDDGAIRKALPYVNGLLKVLTLTAKVGAHAVAGMGQNIPDFSKLISYMLDTPGVLDIDGIPEVVESVEQGMASFAGWQQWLVKVLESNGGITDDNIMKRFKLRRALYEDTSQVAWLCDEHFKSARSLPLIGC